MGTTENYENRVSARVDADLYQKIQQVFHHGQQTQFFRQVFQSLGKLLDEGNFDQVTDYLYKGQALTLPGEEKE